MRQAGEDALAQVRRVLADTRRHDHRVGARHGRVVAADGLLHLVNVHVDGQLRVFVAGRGRVEHIAHIAALARDAQDAALLVQDFVHLVERLALAAHDVRDDRGVDRTRARAHHQALERREAHGRVDGLAVVHGRDRTAVAQMARDEAQVSKRTAQ